MSRTCQITGAKTSYGNNVSHSHRKTRRRWLVNLKTKRLFDEVNGTWVTVRLSTRALRTVNKNGVHQTLHKAGLVK